MEDRSRKPSAAARPLHAIRVACVSYLNALPLIHGLDDHLATPVQRRVPSSLLSMLLDGSADLALLPTVDLFRAGSAYGIVPVGGIGCLGPTLTVRLFSRGPIEAIRQVWADTDSHTSVALLRVLLKHRFGISPTVANWSAGGRIADEVDAVLLIGDKVVASPPSEIDFPEQLDLGAAWHDWTQLPFVFAVWVSRRDMNLGDLPQTMTALLDHNLQDINAVAKQFASTHGWPMNLAESYLGRILRYRIGPPELEAIRHFGTLAAAQGLVPTETAVHLVESNTSGARTDPMHDSHREAAR